MTFTPNSKIYLGSVPFDPGYKHVIYIPDREQQRAQIAARCSFGLNREDYTYQRIGNKIRVPYNAEQLYGLNYCMFQNANYGDRWFYSFITNIEYVSESTSWIYLKEDVFQTWFPDASVQTCYVEREHVNDDTVGKHLKDEGINPGVMNVMYQALDNDEVEMTLVAACAVEPRTDGDYVNNGGDVYFNMYSGTSLSVFLTVSEFQQFLQALANNGQQDALSAVYMVPRWCIGSISEKDKGYGFWVNGNQRTPSKTLTYTLGNTSLNGYVPKNNKMFCYPFTYIELTNFRGDTQQLRSELFGSDGTITLERTGGCDQNSSCEYIPVNYNGIPRATEMSLSLPPFPSVNWVYQTFLNQYGQSKFTYYMPFSDEQYDMNSMTDLPMWRYVAGATQSTAELMSSTLQSIVPAIQSGGMTAKRNAAEGLIGIVPNAVGNTWDVLGGSMEVQADLAKAVRQPNTSRGGTNTSTSLVNLGTYTMGIRKYACSPESAKQCDDFLSAYGYNVSEFKQPNLTGRRSWNYVKTIGMQLHGKLPATAMQDLETMFNTGVTIWHTWDVGNYALDNSII